MQKSYDPQQFEDRIYALWEKHHCFSPSEGAKPFFIPMPPPNVTGALHNGHALGASIQDTLIRWKRLKGFRVLWLPGLDHAGIATQMIVEKSLSEPRKKMGREAFLKHVWDWKKQKGETIFGQLKKIGSSCDWTRSRFTLDPDMNKAVIHAFVRLYQDGLIEKRPAMTNRCVRCETVLSDLEVISKPRSHFLWHIQYANKDATITIATSRPETLLADTAIAVHPEDPRYLHLHGKTVFVPIVNREIPIITDAVVDPTFGSGALKVTPGHDFNDYELGQKHDLACISLFNDSGKIHSDFAEFAGMSVQEARTKVIEILQKTGQLIKTEAIEHQIQCCSRCDQIVEPMVSQQWFVKMEKLAKKTLQAAKKGETLSLEQADQDQDALKILPEVWHSTFYHWLENIRDWCISRQLWWGHRIPAWVCTKGHTTVSEIPPHQCASCEDKELTQDSDVLDTWFSSALWPFASLGWPEKTKDFEQFYPAQVLETGSDILFFWVARMVMLGQYFTGKSPFSRVYLHSMVRDEHGQKMSKTKGNVIDPLIVIQENGADALRFSLTLACNQGQTIRLSTAKILEAQAFCNKLWNASRYCLLQLEQKTVKDPQNIPDLHPINQWILRKLFEARQQVDGFLEEYHMTQASLAVSQFVWNVFCDWYIEFAKELLADPDLVSQTCSVMHFTLKETLKLAHPFIPFITEEIYSHLHQEKLLAQEQETDLAFAKTEEWSASVQMIEDLKSAITAIRNFRGENNLSFKTPIRVSVQLRNLQLEQSMPLLKKLAHLQIDPDTIFKKSSTVLSSAMDFEVNLEGLVDTEEEKKRLKKQVAQIEKDLAHFQKKLSSEAFLEKAPSALIEKERQKCAELEKELLIAQESLLRITHLS